VIRERFNSHSRPKMINTARIVNKTVKNVICL